jgi:two-component system LytT family response regulator/two-component system response regulator LytT
MKVIIVDDEKPAREELRFLLSEYESVEVVGEAESGWEAIELFRRQKPDLLFLDIQMPEMSGIEVANKLYEIGESPHIIFITAYDKFAIEAFDVNAMDYLLKPVEKERLKKSIERYYQNTGRNKVGDLDIDIFSKLLTAIKKPEDKPSRITVYWEDHYHPIEIDDIIAVVADKKFTRILTQAGEYHCQKSISLLEETLSRKEFFRCHRSYLVNLRFIDNIDIWFNNTYQLEMKGIEERIPVSRSQVKEFRRIMAIT